MLPGGTELVDADPAIGGAELEGLQVVRDAAALQPRILLSTGAGVDGGQVLVSLRMRSTGV